MCVMVAVGIFSVGYAAQSAKPTDEECHAAAGCGASRVEQTTKVGNTAEDETLIGDVVRGLGGPDRLRGGEGKRRR